MRSRRECGSQDKTGTSRPRTKPLGFLKATAALTTAEEMTQSNLYFNKITQPAVWRIIGKVLKWKMKNQLRGYSDN